MEIKYDIYTGVHKILFGMRYAYITDPSPQMAKYFLLGFALTTKPEILKKKNCQKNGMTFISVKGLSLMMGAGYLFSWGVTKYWTFGPSVMRILAPLERGGHEYIGPLIGGS